MVVINIEASRLVDQILEEAELNLDGTDRAGILRVLTEKFTQSELDILFRGKADERQIRESIIKLREGKKVATHQSRLAHSLLSFLHCKARFNYFNGHSIEEFDANYFAGFYDFRVFEVDKAKYECFGEKSDSHLVTAKDIWSVARNYHNHINYRLARIAWVYYALSELGRHFGIDRERMLDSAFVMASDAIDETSTRDSEQIDAIYNEVSRRWGQLRGSRPTRYNIPKDNTNDG